MIQPVQDRHGTSPGLPGSVQVSGRVLAVAEMGQHIRLRVLVAEAPTEVHGAVEARARGTPEVQERYVEVRQRALRLLTSRDGARRVDRDLSLDFAG